MKACVLGFLNRLMSAEPRYARAIKVVAWGLGVTFVANVLVVMLECRPLHLSCKWPFFFINECELLVWVEWNLS